MIIVIQIDSLVDTIIDKIIWGKSSIKIQVSNHEFI